MAIALAWESGRRKNYANENARDRPVLRKKSGPTMEVEIKIPHSFDRLEKDLAYENDPPLQYPKYG